jgi:hypothetical protein
VLIAHEGGMLMTWWTLPICLVQLGERRRRVGGSVVALVMCGSEHWADGSGRDSRTRRKQRTVLSRVRCGGDSGKPVEQGPSGKVLPGLFEWR